MSKTLTINQKRASGKIVVAMGTGLLAYAFPDIDLALQEMGIFKGLIAHRSMITHSALPVVATAMMTSFFAPGICKIATLGAAIGLSCHLIPDMFPNGWAGSALIYVPFFGQLYWIPFDKNLIPSIFSFLWLGFNVLAGFVIYLKQKTARLTGN